MNKISLFLLFVLCSACLAMPQNTYGDYESADYDQIYDGTEADEVADDHVINEIPEFEEQSKNITVKEGESVTMSCRTKKKSSLVLLFSKDNERSQNRILFTDNTPITRIGFTANNFTFTVSKARKEHAGTYYCTFQSHTGSDIQISYNVDVQYAPNVKPMGNKKVQKGSDVTLTCEAEGNPTPKISWSREDASLPTKAASVDTGLLITEVDRHDEGKYVCTADNGIGDPAFAITELMVEYGPEIVLEKEIVRTGIDDSVQIACIVHARPAAEVQWGKEGEESLPTGGDVEEIDGSHRHFISIPKVTESDFGSYTCTAANEYGEASASVNLTDLPSSPHMTSDPTGAEENEYTLTWEVESYYPITGYMVKYRKSDANATVQWSEASKETSPEDIETEDLTHTLKHTVTELLPATDYDVVLSVKNEQKWSDTASFKFSTRKARPTTTTVTPPEIPEENASHITAGASTLVFSMVVVLCSLSAVLVS